PVDAGDTCAVVADRANRAGDVRPVEVIVERIARARERVEAVCAGGARDGQAGYVDGKGRRRRPDVRREIRMRVVDAGVDDPDDGVARAEGAIPRGRRMDVGARCADDAVDRLPDVQQAPELGKPWIVWLRRGIQHVVGFGVQDVAAVCEVSEQGLDVLAAGARAPETSVADGAVALSVDLGAKRGKIRRAAER